MSITYTLGGSALTNRVELLEGSEGFTSTARWGDLGTGHVRIHDPDASLTFNGWSTFTVDESDCDPTRVWTGYVVDRRIGRGDKDVSAQARIYDCDLIDLNALLGTRVIRFSDNTGKRPAETDVERVAWLLDSRALSGLIYDQGLVSTANAGIYLAADLRERYALDILKELLGPSVKNAFVYYDHASGNPALFYGKNGDDVWNSLATIRNDGNHDDDSSFAPLNDADLLSREPHDVYSGVSYSGHGLDPIYVQSATTLAAFLDRDAVYHTDRVGKLATQKITSADWLNVRSGETDVIKVSVIVKSSRVNWIEAGQRIQVLFQHLPGYTSLTWTRIVERTAVPVAPGKYRLDLTLWVPPTPVSDADSSGIVQQFSATSSQGSGGSHSFDNPVTAGDLLVIAIAQRNGGSGGSGIDTALAQIKRDNSVGPARPFTSFGTYVHIRSGDVYGADVAAIGYRVATGDEQTLYIGQVRLQYTVYELSHSDYSQADLVSETYHAGSSSKSLSAFTDPGLLEIAVFIVDSGDENETVGSGWTQDAQSDDETTGGHPTTVRMHSTSAATPSIAGVSAEWGGVAVSFPIGLPRTGDGVGPETPSGDVDGSNADFTGAGGWTPGTLRVIHDGFDQTSHVSTEDPEAGTYTLDYAPSAGSTIEIYYESA